MRWPKHTMVMRLRGKAWTWSTFAPSEATCTSIRPPPRRRRLCRRRHPRSRLSRPFRLTRRRRRRQFRRPLRRQFRRPARRTFRRRFQRRKLRRPAQHIFRRHSQRLLRRSHAALRQSTGFGCTIPGTMAGRVGIIKCAIRRRSERRTRALSSRRGRCITARSASIGCASKTAVSSSSWVEATPTLRLDSSKSVCCVVRGCCGALCLIKPF